jgi:hypothetical protein
METTKTSSSPFCLRINSKYRRMMEDLCANEVFQYNKSALIKNLIEAEHAKLLKSNEL